MTSNPSRNTTTGITYEKQISYLLEEFTDINFQTQVVVGKKRNGGDHVVDLLFDGTTYTVKGRKRPISLHEGGVLVSLKFQSVNGSVEERVLFECMKLHHACLDYGYESAIIIIGGNTGWKWKDYYLGEEFQHDMKQIYPTVRIISHEQFIQEFLCD